MVERFFASGTAGVVVNRYAGHCTVTDSASAKLRKLGKTCR